MRKFLIVDDEPLILETLSFMIEEEGYQVVIAKSVDEAISILGKEKVDAIISDVRMPHKSGIDLLKVVKPKHSIPFTFMSGFSELDDSSAKALGAKGLIPKPLDFKDFARTLENALTI